MEQAYDSILIISFGGPEQESEVIPFLENVLRGKNVPKARMLEVAEHYYHFGGKSPINDQTRELITALRSTLDEANIKLPIYWGNRNWHPLLTDTIAQMKSLGHKKVLAFFVAAYSSYSSCRQYRENVRDAQEKAGAEAPSVDKIRVFYNHPLFIEANVSRIHDAQQQLNPEQLKNCHYIMTAHSIPTSMSQTSNYVKQLTETTSLIQKSLDLPPERVSLVYQSRSGRPEDPWLEPDILDHLQELKARGVSSVIIVPIGFLSDHMEIMFDLDTEAAQKCEELGMTMIRAGTVGTHPVFINMIKELIEERLGLRSEKRAIGQYGPNHDVCPIDCCLPPVRPQRPSQSG